MSAVKFPLWRRMATSRAQGRAVCLLSTVILLWRCLHVHFVLSPRLQGARNSGRCSRRAAAVHHDCTVLRCGEVRFRDEHAQGLYDDCPRHPEGGSEPSAWQSWDIAEAVTARSPRVGRVPSQCAWTGGSSLTEVADFLRSEAERGALREDGEFPGAMPVGPRVLELLLAKAKCSLPWGEEFRFVLTTVCFDTGAVPSQRKLGGGGVGKACMRS
eukprot:TRINITY_DN11552_c0_g1_i3.p1 TRINITY_DN11552_c0_g1~~TRINITY_DN11552_c0_g1_i3.p1  ORF type:complete len:214 (-),score=21.37 TRINITY_DN11552_c0_g1_i3:442-1083(-)